MPTRRDAVIGLTLGAALSSLGIYGVHLREVSRQGKEGRQGSLLPDEKALVAAMAEGIIPKTDTPGAIEAGVPDFIAFMFAEWFTDEEQQGFRAGLKGFQKRAKDRFGKPFEHCAAADRHALLVTLDTEADQARRDKAVLPPFARLKALTVIGYYTSEAGQDKELKAEMDAGQLTENGPVFIQVVPWGTMI